MRTVCSVATVRHAEAGAGVAEPVLMARAATALSTICAELLRTARGGVRGARVVGLVGTGNNGGDALWALAALAGRGVGVTAVGHPGRMHTEGAAAARAAGVRVLDWGDPAVAACLAAADLVLDGIVGIGGRGALRAPVAGVVRAVGESGVPVLAVDVPSGIDADTGEVAGDPALGQAVRAAVTVTFGALKAGLVLAPARELAGSVTVVDIGLRPADLEASALVMDLSDLAGPRPAADAHKYRRGVVGVAAGSPQYPGAALLAVGGARRAGAGMVVLEAVGGHDAGVVPLGSMVVARYPDVVLGTPRPLDARCIGPGLGPGREAADRVLAAIEDPAPLVIDASALWVLASRAGRQALQARSTAGWVSVLTPHEGEFARLADPSGGRLVAAQRLADDTGAIVVLKGPGTVVAAPRTTPHVDTFGTAALATAGSGDVLAGLLAGMLAKVAAVAAASGEGLTGPRAAHVAARAVGLHGLAGRLAAEHGGLITAMDVVDHLPDARTVAAAG